MSKLHKLSLMATSTILSTILLSGCQLPQLGSILSNNQQGQSTPATQPSTSTPSENAASDASIAPATSSPQAPNGVTVNLSALPTKLVLAPGSNWKLPQTDGLDLQSSSPEISISNGVISVAKDAQTGDTAVVAIRYQEQQQKIAVTILPSLTDTIRMVNGVPTVTNPEDLLVVVNKQRSLPAGYIPPGLVEPHIPFYFQGKNEKRQLRPEAAKALEELFAGAKQDNIELLGVSGYRSYKTQKGLFDTYVKTQGIEHAAQYSAVPGKSEHQTGLSIDVSGADSKTRLEESFENTPEGRWLKQHAAEYGFIIRYPKGKEAITGYNYEPWHIRYVGKTIAQEIAKQGITLEEYFQEVVPAAKAQ